MTQPQTLPRCACGAEAIAISPGRAPVVDNLFEFDAASRRWGGARRAGCRRGRASGAARGEWRRTPYVVCSPGAAAGRRGGSLPARMDRRRAHPATAVRRSWGSPRETAAFRRQRDSGPRASAKHLTAQLPTSILDGMKLVAALKMLPTPEQAACLTATLARCNEACAWLARASDSTARRSGNTTCTKWATVICGSGSA